ncbi:MAG: putative transport system permease protein [Methanothermococcus sp.]|uniref:ABC transporter permease n=1 Tax=Methanothermococcus TaxID=155862 RepID=UPI00035F8EAF|nr:MULTISPECIES: ABC transporter permease [Methanothermococcus]MDK2790698.1 putative transport system permease protein [Methanothermococcus sp.]
MKIIDVISFAGKNLKQKRTQSLLTIIGIVIGTIAIVSLISLGYGVQNYVKDETAKLGANKIQIFPMKQFGTPPSKLFGDKEIKAIKNIRGVDEVLYGWYSGANIERRDEKYFVNIFYAKPSSLKSVYSDVGGYGIEKGRWLSDNDNYKCIIGHGAAYNLFKKELGVGDTIYIDGKKFKIVGIMTQVGNQQDDNMVIIPMSSGEELFNKKGEYNYIMVKIKDSANIKKVSEDIKDALEKSMGTDNFSVLTAEQMAKSIGGILSVLTMFVAGVAGISLLVGAVGISNTMHMSILERRKDIGILKALGAETTTILKIFVVEAGFLGLLGGIVGLIIGIIIAKLIEIAAQNMGYGMIQAWISWELVVGVLAFSFFVGIISGYFPARSGAKLNPVDTLRGE